MIEFIDLFFNHYYTGRLGHPKTFLKNVKKPKTYYW